MIMQSAPACLRARFLQRALELVAQDFSFPPSMEVVMRLRFSLFVIAVIMVALVRAASASPTMTTAQPAPKPIPANYVQVSPCIPTMGWHYANPKAPLAGSTIYGAYQGKPVFTEIMLLPKDFAAGKDWDDVLKPLPGYAIDHVDIDFLPHGHPGMPFPHYDLHAYYVPHAVHMQYCGGMAALKKMMSGSMK